MYIALNAFALQQSDFKSQLHDYDNTIITLHDNNIMINILALRTVN